MGRDPKVGFQSFFVCFLIQVIVVPFTLFGFTGSERGAWYVVGAGRLFLLANLMTMALPTYIRGSGGKISRGPVGVLCVVYSSRSCRAVDTCSRHFVRAPGVSQVTGRNMQFAGDFITGSLDNPDHTYLLANGRDRGGNFASGAGHFSNDRRAFPGLLRRTNCRATIMKG